MTGLGDAMGMTYAEATALVEKARVAVNEQAAIRDEARDKFNAAREALEQSQQALTLCKESIDDLQIRLRKTREAIMPNEAACKRALLEWQATQEALAVAQRQRLEAERHLKELETERDQAEELLGGAEQNLELSGVQETSSRASLNERVQFATDAQRALDAALKMIEDAKEDVRREEEKLSKLLQFEESLPKHDDALESQVQRKRTELEKAVRASENAAKKLEDTRLAQVAAESSARELKVAYENAQANLRTAISAADRADTRLQEASLKLNPDEEEVAELNRLRAEYAAALDVRSAAMEINASTLTELADADVEAIRMRIACDNASSELDMANAQRARAERELREAQEASSRAVQELQNSKELVAAQEERLRLARENLEKLELDGKKAAEKNAAAQKDLRAMQEEAVRYGRESRAAADTLDGRRHELSGIVAAIEVGREQLYLLRDREDRSAANVDSAYLIHQDASRALADAHDFIEHAKQEIEKKRVEMKKAERSVEQMKVEYRKADEVYSSAQRDYEVANSDLTDAEVSVIMAEIDERLL